MLAAEKPFLQELCLELLKGDVQIAHTVGRQVAAIELVCAVARKDGDAAEGNDLHAVFRPEAQAHRAGAKHDAAERTGLVLEGKVVVPRGIDLVVAQLAANEDLAQKLVTVEHGFDVFVDLRDRIDRLLHHGSSCIHVRMATPSALSVEKRGSANAASNSRQRSRRSELPETPPEKTTEKPGYCLSASRVTAVTA